MKWKYLPLPYDDLKAKTQIFDNLSMGAHEHTLTKKLVERFSTSSGRMLLIAFDSLDPDSEYLYRYGLYDGGKGLREAIGTQSVAWTDSPRWGLIECVGDWLHVSRDAVVLCENWAAKREHLLSHARESVTCCFGPEVYHVLKNENADNCDAIECTLRESEHHWATGVCSRCAEVPVGEILSEAFFDGIVANTAHIFTPALDGEGYLVSSPGT